MPRAYDEWGGLGNFIWARPTGLSVWTVGLFLPGLVSLMNWVTGKAKDCFPRDCASQGCATRSSRCAGCCRSELCRCPVLRSALTAVRGPLDETGDWGQW